MTGDHETWLQLRQLLDHLRDSHGELFTEQADLLKLMELHDRLHGVRSLRGGGVGAYCG